MLYMLQQSLRTTSSTARPGMLQAEIVENLIHGRVPFDTQSGNEFIRRGYMYRRHNSICLDLPGKYPSPN